MSGGVSDGGGGGGGGAWTDDAGATAKAGLGADAGPGVSAKVAATADAGPGVSEYFTVTGGAASTVAFTEDLDRAVRVLDEAAEHMDAVTRASSVLKNTVSQTAAGVPSDWISLLAAQHVILTRLDAVMYGPRGSRTAADMLGDVAARLAAAVRAMEEAESAAQRSVSGWQKSTDAATSLLGTGAWVSQTATSWLTGLMPGPIAVPPPGGAPPTTGWLNRDTVDGAVGALPTMVRQALLSASIEALRLGEYLEGERQWVDAREVQDTSGMVAPRCLRDLVWNDMLTEQRGDGAVTVQEVTGADGVSRFIVTIPGTQDWGFDDNIFDGTSNLQMMKGPLTGAGGDNADYLAGGTGHPLFQVVAAMHQAQVPQGAEVMLVGHSQGGIVAGTLASSASFLSTYSVTHVVTTGSPVGEFVFTDATQGLHLEHQEDIVPGTDGRPVPVTAHRTTFTHDLSASDDSHLVELSRTVLGAHSYDGYLATAALAESGVSGSVDAFVTSAQAYFDPSATVTTRVFVPVVVGDTSVTTGASGAWCG